MKLAVLSNTNLNYVIRMLSKGHTVYQTEGYGNELGTLMNPSSSYHAFCPQITFLIMDIMELVDHGAVLEECAALIADWFDGIEACIREGALYYISDAVLIGQEKELLPRPYRDGLEQGWNLRLARLTETHPNVRLFPYRDFFDEIGRRGALSFKTWYMGRILLGMEAQRVLADKIEHILTVESRVPKKLLVLDLDNTLWGGLAGENDQTPVALSEEHSGLIYKDCQRVIKRMQQQGVMLAIASKNNEEDALALIDHHPHMLLRSTDFVSRRINWNPKDASIREIAAELNIATDSFVFWDDSPAERDLVRRMCPEVEVPEFPALPEEMPRALVELYHTYFEKPLLTAEDREKTRQYAANARRNALKRCAASFDDYLKGLDITVIREDSRRHKERIVQLCNKTNQFNLTTKRFSESEMADLLASPDAQVLAYRVTDKFGDSGLVAVVIVSLDAASRSAAIEEFVMSCRVMGRLIEYAILSDVESFLKERNVEEVRGHYIPTQKNAPVKTFYPQAGYQDEGDGKYRRRLDGDTACRFVATIRNTEA